MTSIGDFASTHPTDGQVERVVWLDLLVLGGKYYLSVMDFNFEEP